MSSSAVLADRRNGLGRLASSQSIKINQNQPTSYNYSSQKMQTAKLFKTLLCILLITEVSSTRGSSWVFSSLTSSVAYSCDSSKYEQLGDTCSSSFPSVECEELPLISQESLLGASSNPDGENLRGFKAFFKSSLYHVIYIQFNLVLQYIIYIGEMSSERSQFYEFWKIMTLMAILK